MTVQSLVAKTSVFDFEVMGLKKPFHQPTQVAFTEPTFKFPAAPRVFEASIRRSPLSVAEPEAILATGVPFSSLNDKSRRTKYAVALGLAGWLSEQKNTKFFSFTGFDRGIMQHLLFQSLCDPFTMSKNGRVVCDARETLLTSSVLESDFKIMRLPDGSWSSTQEAFASANGVTYEAHDAGRDTAALSDLLRLATCDSPELVETLSLTLNKHRLSDATCNASFYLKPTFSRAGGPRVQACTIIGPHPKYSNQQLALQLGFVDDREGLDLALQTIATAHFDNFKYCRFKANDAPMTILPGQTAMDQLLAREQQNLLVQIANLARRNASLYEECCAAEIAKIDSYTSEDHPELRMISDGFWTSTDMAIARRFHASDPDGKLALLDEMEDMRMKVFAERILYSDWPEALPAKTLRRLDEFCAWRLRTTDQVPWTTVPAALDKIEELLPTCLAKPRQLLLDYQKNLLELQSNPIQR